ncbi:hypothetical protein H0H93_007668 [Arthromyces matolae]|nr:hypothetical protein H0H93_007668 [Arthromyces matolae]
MAYSFLESRPSPIHKLPVELLSHIFLLVRHDGSGDEEFPSIDAESIKRPLILSEVNSHWRNVCRRTPSLWTSICITAGLVDSTDQHNSQRQTSCLDTSHIVSCLALSGACPLDILIDARDEYWDFSEPEVSTNTEEYEPYVPPFNSSHMSTAMALLVPHLPRWRSLSILTDTWFPMYIALQAMQPSIAASGAPCLESLTLMRCNDFVSHSPTFQPPELREPAFLSTSDSSPRDILPRLCNLSLRGVHVHWQSLSDAISVGQHGLKSLDLSSHCSDVRPSLDELGQLLSHCPELETLVLNGSGARIPDNDESSIVREDIQPVKLHRLQQLTIGYRSEREAKAILGLLDAPGVEDLTLQDSTHPMEIVDIDAGGLLTYLATGSFPVQESHEPLYVWDDDDSLMSRDDFSFASDLPKSAVAVVACNASSKAVFPFLRSLSIRGIKSYPSAFSSLLNFHPHLRHIDLDNVSTHWLRALLPQPSLASDPLGVVQYTCPCPHLKTLSIRGSERMGAQDSVLLASALARERFNFYGPALEEVNIRVDHSEGYIHENTIELSKIGTVVNLLQDSFPSDEDLDLMDCDTDSELDPYEVGGVFNDPVFDAQFSFSQGGLTF